MSNHDWTDSVNRRAFLGRTSGGLGMAALTGLLQAEDVVQADPAGLAPGISTTPHLPVKAKRVIFLCMAGGPSHLESFDYKPKLKEMHGKPMPTSFTANQPIAQLQGQKLVCQAPLIPFQRYGESGQRITEIFPHIGSVADDICIINSLHTDQINHDPAHTVMNTGTSISGRPSMGSWITYGLGSASSNLPGFVVLTSKGGRNPQPIATRQWHSGFLPGRFQGIQFNSSGDPVHYVRNPLGVSNSQQKHVIEVINGLNGLRDNLTDNPEIRTRIQQYELAFRMQQSVPELMDISQETQETLDLYGVSGADGSYAYNCLLARRLAESGVRFIHLYHRGWDHHNDLVRYMGICSGLCDQPTAALIKDLKQRDMLKDTLVIFGGEFGRTPMAQTNKGPVGRDHHMRAFSMFMAGGGIRGGVTYGATDELGYNAVENVVHINDLHATMLHQLGLDHERLTFQYQGRDFRLTDVAGEVIKPILA
ncbi:MAG: sulfatase [Planctomycetaceae bacterium]|nr:sulfatase [Planctomycetaceae bacterium]